MLTPLWHGGVAGNSLHEILSREPEDHQVHAPLMSRPGGAQHALPHESGRLSRPLRADIAGRRPDLGPLDPLLRQHPPRQQGRGPPGESLPRWSGDIQ